MPRFARLDAPGVLHHVIIRGIERRNIFKNDQDRNNFLERLATLLPETRISCYAWAFMSNHAHFLFRTSDVSLSTLMRRLLTGYVVTFNRRHKRYGPLFQNRYKSVLCQEDPYLMELVRYIHLNPLRAKIVSTVSELNRYEYSGHSVLMGKCKRDWQEMKYVLSFFDKSIGSARKRYLSYVEAGLKQGRRPELVGGGLIRSLGGWREVKKKRFGKEGRFKGDHRILGESEFVAQILEEAEEKYERSYELKSKGYDLEVIEKRVCALLGIEKGELYSDSRRQAIAEARGLFCYWAVRELGCSLAEIGQALGRSGPGVGYAVQRGERLANQQKYKLIE